MTRLLSVLFAAALAVIASCSEEDSFLSIDPVDDPVDDPQVGPAGPPAEGPARWIWSGGADGVLSSEIDAAGPGLNPKAYRFLDGDVRSIAATPDGRFVYVSRDGGNGPPELVLYRVDPLTGVPDQGTALTNVTDAAGRLAVDATGQYLVLLGTDLAVWRIEATAGGLTLQIRIGTGMGAISVVALHPTQNLIYLLDVGKIITRRLPGLEPVSHIDIDVMTLGRGVAMKAHPDGFVYLAHDSGLITQLAAASEVVIAGGAEPLELLTPATFDVGQAVARMAVAGDVFVTIPGTDTVQRLAVAPSGALSAGPPLQLPGTPDAIVATNGETVYVAGFDERVWTLDTATTLRLASTTHVRGPRRSDGHALAVVHGNPATSRSTEWVFVTDRDADTVAAFRHDAATGLSATSQGLVPTSDQPVEVTLDSQRTHVYVTCASGVIDTFDFDVDTGGLGRVVSTMVGTTASQFVLSRCGRFAYAFDDGALYSFPVDAATGALGARSWEGTSSTAHAATVDPAGTTLFVGADKQIIAFGLDPYGGTIGGGSVTTGYLVSDLALNPSGTVLYASDPQDSKVWKYDLDPAFGWEPDAATASSLTAGSGTERLALDPVGMRLFATAPDSGELHAFRVNPTSGKLTNLLIPFNLAAPPRSVAVEGSGDRVFVGLDGGIARHAVVDLGDGAGDEIDVLPLPLGAEPVGLASDATVE